MRALLSKFSTHLGFAFILTMLASNYGYTQIIIPFSGNSYIDGAEAARRANQEDRMHAESLRRMQIENNNMQRQQAIAEYFGRYNTTGDYRYLFHAAELGSDLAANILRQNRVNCFRSNNGNLVCKSG